MGKVSRISLKAIGITGVERIVKDKKLKRRARLEFR